jgi:hypothetical protein
MGKHFISFTSTTRRAFAGNGAGHSYRLPSMEDVGVRNLDEGLDMSSRRFQARQRNRQ